MNDTTATGSAILFLDEKLKVCYANTLAARLLARAPEDLGGLPLAAVEDLFSALGAWPPGGRLLLGAVTQKVPLREMHCVLKYKESTKETPGLRICLNASPLFHDGGHLKGLLVDFAPCSPWDDERLHPFIGAMDEVVFEFDDKGRYLHIWSQGEALLRRPRSELLGRSFAEFLPKDLARAFHSALRQVRRSGQAATVEYPLDVMGGTRWFLGRIALVPPACEGEPTFSFLARDITERKRLEERLSESEGRFRGLFENAAAGIALVDLEGRCIETNRVFREMFGYSEAELRRKSFSTYSHPEDLVADLEQCERLARGEIESYRMEKRFFRKDGSVLWGHLTASLLRNARGEPSCFIGIVEDISRRKKAEAERERLLGELEAIFSAAGDGIVVYDEKGMIVRVNDAARTMLGYSDDLLAAPLAERYRLWAPRREDGSAYALEESALYRAFQGESSKGVVTQFWRRDGSAVWIIFSASPIYDPSGVQVGAVATLTDITRMRELQKRQEDYLHMLAHDLRSPLTIISGYAEVLETRLADSHPDALEWVQAILGAAQQMHAMMEDLVETGRIESGQVSLHRDVIDLAAFVADFLRDQTAADRERVKMEIPPDLPYVQIGKTHLKRILANLTGNALRYSGDQPVLIRFVGAEPQGVCLAVADRGKGIAPEDQGRIFERFYRTPDARKQTGLGTGLGLYITKKLLGAYGGSIRVESAPGEGATFIICLPEAQSER